MFLYIFLDHVRRVFLISSVKPLDTLNNCSHMFRNSLPLNNVKRIYAYVYTLVWYRWHINAFEASIYLHIFQQLHLWVSRICNCTSSFNTIVVFYHQASVKIFHVPVPFSEMSSRRKTAYKEYTGFNVSLYLTVMEMLNVNVEMLAISPHKIR